MQADVFDVYNSDDETEPKLEKTNKAKKPSGKRARKNSVDEELVEVGMELEQQTANQDDSYQDELVSDTEEQAEEDIFDGMPLPVPPRTRIGGKGKHVVLRTPTISSTISEDMADVPTAKADPPPTRKYMSVKDVFNVSYRNLLDVYDLIKFAKYGKSKVNEKPGRVKADVIAEIEKRYNELPEEVKQEYKSLWDTIHGEYLAYYKNYKIEKAKWDARHPTPAGNEPYTQQRTGRPPTNNANTQQTDTDPPLTSTALTVKTMESNKDYVINAMKQHQAEDELCENMHREMIRNIEAAHQEKMRLIRLARDNFHKQLLH